MAEWLFIVRWIPSQQASRSRVLRSPAPARVAARSLALGQLHVPSSMHRPHLTAPDHSVLLVFATAHSAAIDTPVATKSKHPSRSHSLPPLRSTRHDQNLD